MLFRNIYKMKILNRSQQIYMIFTFTCLQTCCGVDAGSQVLSKTLYDDLMTNYDSSLIPICNRGTAVTLNIDIALREIMDLHEKEQLLITNIWMRMSWNDCRLTWNPTSYNNLTSFTVTYDDIWIPDITLYDSASDSDMLPGIKNNRAYISSSGSVTYNFPTVVKSICKVNVRYFPFDTQECPLQFGSWSHHGNELDIVNRNPQGDIDTYIVNAEWVLSDFPVERHVLHYNCCPEPYPDVTYYVNMKRRTTFYVLTMIFPFVLTALVSVLGFVLPVESGEKVSLQITVLLSLAVFLLLISESLPPASDNFPIIGIYFTCSMGFVAASLVQTVIVINMFYRGRNGRTVPGWARLCFFRVLEKVLCVRTRSRAVRPIEKDDECFSERLSQRNNKKECESLDKNENVTVLKNKNIEIKTPAGSRPDTQTNNNVSNTGNHTKKAEKQRKRRPCTNAVNSEWRDLANVLDRLFLILYLLVTLITTLAFFLQWA